jgi:hypothetical protein
MGENEAKKQGYTCQVIGESNKPQPPKRTLKRSQSDSCGRCGFAGLLWRRRNNAGYPKAIDKKVPVLGVPTGVKDA